MGSQFQVPSWGEMEGRLRKLGPAVSDNRKVARECLGPAGKHPVYPVAKVRSGTRDSALSRAFAREPDWQQYRP